VSIVRQVERNAAELREVKGRAPGWRPDRDGV